jgi:hypothetical protein
MTKLIVISSFGRMVAVRGTAAIWPGIPLEVQPKIAVRPWCARPPDPAAEARQVTSSGVVGRRTSTVNAVLRLTATAPVFSGRPRERRRLSGAGVTVARMRCGYLAWGDAVELFERRGLPKSTYGNLYEEEYILVPGPASVTGELPLDEHERTPWQEDTPEGATGYVVDGDLTVDGNIVDIDDGAAALIVLGNLRAKDIYLEGDTKLIVLGDVTAEAFVGDMTDKLVMIHGDLRTTAAIFWNEFCPDLVAGTLYGRTLAPAYLDLPTAPIGGLVDPAPDAPLDTLLVPELLITGAPAPGDFPEIGIRGAALRERILGRLPLTRTP